MKDIITVTCWRDINNMVLLSSSINLFVTNPCTHWVIVEDKTQPLEKWRELLGQYYTYHTLNLISANEFLKNRDYDLIGGWYKQQILKFMIAERIKDETYLILDSKNFFINSINLNDWPVEEGMDSCRGGIEEKWNTWISVINKKTNLPTPDYFWNPETPFKVKTSVVKQILREFPLDLMLNISGDCPHVSEFILYRFYSNAETKNTPKISTTFWPGTDISFLKNLVENDLIVLGLHRGFLEKHSGSLDFFIAWAERKGFQRSLVSNVLNSFI